MRLIKSRFEKWLKAKSPEEIVGTNRDCHTCPIANFYTEASGGCEIVIFESVNGGYIADRGYYRQKLPDWAEYFVSSVDGEGRDTLITAGRALELLA